MSNKPASPTSVTDVRLWCWIAAWGILSRRYEYIIYRLCLTAAVVYCFASGLYEIDFLDLLALNNVTIDLFRYKSETDAIGNHFTFNIIAVSAVYSVRRTFPELCEPFFWGILIFLAPMFLHNVALQLWIQRQIASQMRFDKDIRQLSLMGLERAILGIINGLKSTNSWILDLVTQLGTWIPHFSLKEQTLSLLFAVTTTLYYDWSTINHEGLPEHMYSSLWPENSKSSEEEHKPKFRLLLLYPCFAFLPIRCCLLKINFESRRTVQYEAVSYTWGDNTRTHSILLDGCTKKVTRSVHELLGRQSSLFMPKLLWIDAICIDQDNIEEKNNQVSLMDKIYSEATLVTVFLGKSPLPSEKNSPAQSHFQLRYEGILDYVGLEKRSAFFQDASVATDLINELRVLEKKLEVQEESKEDDMYSTYAKLSHSRKRNRWEPMLNLLQHPWFERVWVVQEVALARSIVVVYGDEILNWTGLVRTSEVLQKNDYLGVWFEHCLLFQTPVVKHGSLHGISRIEQFRKRMTGCSKWSLSILRLERALSLQRHLERQETDPTALKYTKKLHAGQRKVIKAALDADRSLGNHFVGEETPPSLSDLLIESFHYKATEPKDLIFGLMAICKQPVQIVYEATVEEVYFSAAKTLVDQNTIHLLFHGIGFRDSASGASSSELLPSWVPDWRVKPMCVRLLDQEDDGMWKEFTAGGNPLDTGFRLVTYKRLQRRGFIIDSIEQIWTLPSADEDPFIYLYRLGLAYAQICADIADFQDNAPQYTHNPPSQSIFDAIRRTFTTDRKIGVNQKDINRSEAFEALVNFIIQAIKIERERELPDDDIDTLIEISKSLLILSVKMKPAKASCAGRNFFRSKNGYIGLCPHQAAKDDMICVFPGLPVPIMLRAISSSQRIKSKKGRRPKGASLRQCRLVGECYVNGLMRGEAMSLKIAHEDIQII